MQRRRLVLAFSEILAEDGLDGAGIGHVCKRAGVSRRTFYDLFDDREGCFLAVLDSALECVSQRVLPAYQGEGPTPKGACRGRTRSWRERLRAALTALLETFDEEPALVHVCLGEILKGGPVVLERRRETLELLAKVVDEGRSEAKHGTGLPSVTAQGAVGGAVAIVHAHLLAGLSPTGDAPRTGSASPRRERSASFIELLNPLMSMIVLPYLGPAAARCESERPTPKPAYTRNGHMPAHPQDPFKDLPIRLTFRTARVLATIGDHPGANNRQVGEEAGVPDQGQISKLLRRLQGHGLIENRGEGHTRGEPNAWRLTERGHAIQHVIETPVAH
jgi:AcrR family transcriptional regulator